MAFQSGSVCLFFKNFVSIVIVFVGLSSRDMVNLYVLFLLKKELTSISPSSSLGKYDISFFL